MSHEVLRPAAFACLVIASSACQPQGPGIQAASQAGMARGPAGSAAPEAAGPAGRNPVTYFGDLFSKEEEALAARPLELSLAPPTF